MYSGLMILVTTVRFIYELDDYMKVVCLYASSIRPHKCEPRHRIYSS